MQCCGPGRLHRACFPRRLQTELGVGEVLVHSPGVGSEYWPWHAGRDKGGEVDAWAARWNAEPRKVLWRAWWAAREVRKWCITEVENHLNTNSKELTQCEAKRNFAAGGAWAALVPFRVLLCLPHRGARLLLVTAGSTTAFWANPLFQLCCSLLKLRLLIPDAQ